MTPKVRSMSYRRAPKVAFLFLARGDLPLRPLWEKFFAGHQGLYSIYVHTDPSYTGSPPEDSVFYGHMIPSQVTNYRSITIIEQQSDRILEKKTQNDRLHWQKTTWGDVSLVAAERRLLANALVDVGNERFALLSELCIPLYNFTTVHAVLTGTDTSFVDVIVTPARYNPLFLERNNITAAQWRKGEEWFEMDRSLALEVVSDDAYFPTFRERCAGQRACLMDEHYVPSRTGTGGAARGCTTRTRTARRRSRRCCWRRSGEASAPAAGRTAARTTTRPPASASCSRASSRPTRSSRCSGWRPRSWASGETAEKIDRF